MPNSHNSNALKLWNVRVDFRLPFQFYLLNNNMKGRWSDGTCSRIAETQNKPMQEPEELQPTKILKTYCIDGELYFHVLCENSLVERVHYRDTTHPISLFILELLQSKKALYCLVLQLETSVIPEKVGSDHVIGHVARVVKYSEGAESRYLSDHFVFYVSLFACAVELITYNIHVYAVNVTLHVAIIEECGKQSDPTTYTRWRHWEKTSCDDSQGVPSSTRDISGVRAVK
jgi:hypothetical protein